MKKLIGAILVIIMAVFAFSACTGGQDEKGNVNDETGGSGITEDNGNTEGGTQNPPASAVSEMLIVYFSCTNTTETVVQHIQSETGGTLYKIQPEIPYTADDLKYYTNGRADREQADASARPAINGGVEYMEKYGVVFLGYPIWHGQAPKIICTFLESYNFSGKKIIPFCTSQSSGTGNSDKNLHQLAPSAEWAAGRRFSSSTTREDVAGWIDGLRSEYDWLKKCGEEEITAMYLTINGNKIEVTLAENSSAEALVEILKQGDITYTADDYGNFEKVGDIGHTLPQNNMQITTQAGDVILYQGRNICLYYDTNSWNFTRIGKINGYSDSELKTLLCAGTGKVNVTISLK